MKVLHRCALCIGICNISCNNLNLDRYNGAKSIPAYNSIKCGESNCMMLLRHPDIQYRTRREVISNRCKRKCIINVYHDSSTTLCAIKYILLLVMLMTNMYCYCRILKITLLKQKMNKNLNKE